MKPYLKHIQLNAAAYWHKRRTEALLAVIVLCLAGSMLLLAYQGQQIRQTAINNRNYNAQQLKAIKKVVDQINTASQTRTAQLQALTDHIDCIATFFEQQASSHAVLKDLDRCIITTSAGGQPTVTSPKPNGGTANSSAPKATAQASPAAAKQPAQSGRPPAPKNCTIDLLGLHLLCP